MKKATPNAPMRDEYDFTAGQRGRYAKRFAAGVNLVRVDEDLQADFPDSAAVNQALRKFRQISKVVGK
ncbi:MAG: hypothetical protein ACYC26_10555 [Phycisphaerales bacterium]